MADEPETRFFDVRITAVVAIEETDAPAEPGLPGRPTPDELVEAVRRHADDLKLDALTRLRNIYEAITTSGVL